MSDHQSVVITGVSTGIGYAAVQSFINRGYHVFGSLRKEADATRLKESFPENFTPLLFDVTNRKAIDKAIVQVENKLNGHPLSGLINNAGMAIGGPLELLPIEDIRQQFEVNVLGLLQVTKAFLPLLGGQPDFTGEPGKIINISSVGGKIAAPFIGPYVGTKHAVEGISHTLRRELQVYGIDVIIVGPGAVQTPIWDKGTDPEPYTGTIYESAIRKFTNYFVKEGKNGLPPEQIGELLADIMENPNPKTRYAPVPNKFRNWTIPRLLPDRMIDKTIQKNLGLFRKNRD